MGRCMLVSELSLTHLGQLVLSDCIVKSHAILRLNAAQEPWLALTWSQCFWVRIELCYRVHLRPLHLRFVVRPVEELACAPIHVDSLSLGWIYNWQEVVSRKDILCEIKGLQSVNWLGFRLRFRLVFLAFKMVDELHEIHGSCVLGVHSFLFQVGEVIVQWHFDWLAVQVGFRPHCRLLCCVYLSFLRSESFSFAQKLLAFFERIDV